MYSCLFGSHVLSPSLYSKLMSSHVISTDIIVAALPSIYLPFTSISVFPPVLLLLPVAKTVSGVAASIARAIIVEKSFFIVSSLLLM